ncbi:MAG: anthranilate synthase component I [Firmicutes bacterium]|nr:anthranilate synthase component I [Bacillota bacterium]
MFYPDLNMVKELSREYNVIPVSMEVYADTETPISLFKRFKENKYCFLLESVEGGEKWARYSFIGRDPFIVVKSINRETLVQYRNGKFEMIPGNPVQALSKVLEAYKGAKIPGIPRFNGGAVGYLSYDTVRYYEQLPDSTVDDLGLPESHFMIVDEVLAFDHLKQKIHIIVNMFVEGNIERCYKSVTERLKEIYSQIQLTRWKASDNLIPQPKVKKREFVYESNISKEEFCNTVLKAKEYIRNGDIFQVVLSQRLKVDTKEDPFNVYRVLRTINPSPYMYYLKFGEYQIAGASPEMLVRVENNLVETSPIAGTRKRGLTNAEDDLLEKELLSDEKELAEHIMLVDLGRNDIGKVSKYGTVRVNDLMHVEKYSHVMHIVTNIQGELREDKTPFDALVSVLPAGTLSGAPKVRAMEIIDELEKTRRGIYGGAIGYFSFNGNVDSCITIRTILFQDSIAYVQAGAGIVADSVPEKEYEESLNKAMALLKALEKVGEIK